MGFKATDLSSVSATFWFVTSLPLSLSAFSFKLAPAVLLDHETTKVTVLSVQGFQITAAIILGLRPLTCLPRIPALHTALEVFKDLVNNMILDQIQP